MSAPPPTDDTAFRARWQQIAEQDAHRPFHHVIHTREPLIVEPKALGMSSELVAALETEDALLQYSAINAELPAYERFRVELRSSEGHLRVLERLSSPSVVIRAIAAMFLWQCPERTYRRRAVAAAGFFLDWYRIYAVEGFATHDNGLLLGATSVFGRACELTRLANQPVRPLFEAAAQFATEATSAGEGRWILEVAQALASLPSATLAAAPEVDGISSALRAQADHFATAGNPELQRMLIEADVGLRREAGRPAVQTHSPLSMAQSLEAQAMAHPSALVRGEFLRDAIEAYRRLGDRGADVRRLEVQLEQSVVEARAELRGMEVTTTIPNEVIGQLLHPYTTLPVDQAVRFLAQDAQFLVDEPTVTRQAAEAAVTHPLQGLIRRRVLHPGATSHTSTTDEEHERDRVFEHATRSLQILGQFLQMVLHQLRHRGLTAEHLLEAIFGQGSPLEPGERPILESAVRAWLNRDFVACVSILTPRLERSLRRICALTGHAALWSREGADEQIGLSSTLAHLDRLPGNPETHAVFFTARAVLEERSAGGYRHLVAHGLLEANGFNEPLANLLLYLLLQIANLQVEARAEPSPALPSAER